MGVKGAPPPHSIYISGDHTVPSRSNATSFGMDMKAFVFAASTKRSRRSFCMREFSSRVDIGCGRVIARVYRGVNEDVEVACGV